MQRGPDLAMARDRRFEATFLQRRVHCEPNFLAFYRTATTCFSTRSGPRPWADFRSNIKVV